MIKPEMVALAKRLRLSRVKGRQRTLRGISGALAKAGFDMRDAAPCERSRLLKWLGLRKTLMATQMKVVLEQILAKAEFTFQLIRTTLHGRTYNPYVCFIYAYILGILSPLGDHRDCYARFAA
ncbi:hypothetical protein J4G37_30105 [Microvirga sp. 3-52]|nr:hypothetical protein [Microvirga sp. 3-52]